MIPITGSIEDDLWGVGGPVDIYMGHQLLGNISDFVYSHDVTTGDYSLDGSVEATRFYSGVGYMAHI